jgi:4-amino-4-deoxy-L-arabinose transferase-like glycosyltransferase
MGKAREEDGVFGTVRAVAGGVGRGAARGVSFLAKLIGAIIGVMLLATVLWIMRESGVTGSPDMMLGLIVGVLATAWVRWWKQS